VFQVEKKEITVAAWDNHRSSCWNRPDCLYLDTCHDHRDPVLGGPEDSRSLQNRQQAQEELSGRGRGPWLTHSVSASGIDNLIRLFFYNYYPRCQSTYK